MKSSTKPNSTKESDKTEESQSSSNSPNEEIFAELARKESDCSTYKRGGDLGLFKKATMQKAFSRPAFALEVNEMSGIVESNSGYHIILRVA